MSDGVNEESTVILASALDKYNIMFGGYRVISGVSTPIIGYYYNGDPNNRLKWFNTYTSTTNYITLTQV